MPVSPSATGMLWLKAVHVIFVVSWFAALFYLPRLFVYHCEVAADDGVGQTRFQTMERKLYGLGLIAMSGSWLFGLAMIAANPGYLHSGAWLHAKLALVLLLSGYYGWLRGCVRRFANGGNRRSARFYRIVNEVPALLLIAIVILVIVKPI